MCDVLLTYLGYVSTYSYSVTSWSSLRVPGIMFTLFTSGALGSRLGSSELVSMAGEILKQIVK